LHGVHLHYISIIPTTYYVGGGEKKIEEEANTNYGAHETGRTAVIMGRPSLEALAMAGVEWEDAGERESSSMTKKERRRRSTRWTSRRSWRMRCRRT
jgi:hypothetical protein